jgi:inorganic pyrophosphatase
VAIHAQTHQDLKSLRDLRPHLLEEIKGFFVDYNKLRNRKFKPQNEAGPRRAREIVDAGMKAFDRQRKKEHAK